MPLTFDDQTEPSEPLVDIIILNWNNTPDTIACAQSLLDLSYSNYRIIICDNASSQQSIADLIKWGKSLNISLSTPCFREFQHDEIIKSGSNHRAVITLIHTGGNLGYAGGVNVGIRFSLQSSNSEYVWILNNDTEVSPQTLQAMLGRMESDKSIGICGSTLIYFHKREMVQAFAGAQYNPWKARSIAIGAFSNILSIPSDSADVERKMSYVNGASMLVTREFVNTVGVMDESYFLYSEEHDWAKRGLDHGYKLGYAPKAIVYHKHGATIGTHPSGGSPLSLFYLYRNKLVFSYRFHRALTPIAFLFLFLDSAKLFLKGYPSKSLAVVRGLLAAPWLSKY